MKKRKTYSRLKNEFSQIFSVLKYIGFKMTSVLRNDFSLDILCPNPPALAGGRLRINKR